MTIEARIRELGNRHRMLDQAIQREYAHPSSDPLRVREMKQQKLRLKEQIGTLEQRTG